MDFCFKSDGSCHGVLRQRGSDLCLKDHSGSEWRRDCRREKTIAVIQVGEDGGWNYSGKWTWEEMDRLGTSGDRPADRLNGKYGQGKKKKLLGF